MEVTVIDVKERKILRVAAREYALVFSVSVVATLEEKLGRSMKHPMDWFRIQTKELVDILDAGLTHHHKDESRKVAEIICNILDPEEIETVIDALCVAACPKAMARIKEQMEKAQERTRKGLPPLPNAESVAAN